MHFKFTSSLTVKENIVWNLGNTVKFPIRNVAT